MNYIIAEEFSNTKRVEFINNKEFAVASSNKNPKAFIIHIKTLITISIYLT